MVSGDPVYKLIAIHLLIHVQHSIYKIYIENVH